ncbi:hypothetical protein GOV11_04685 [Candidatus Woesearchaeota archaeon]|nr:hypothetical protein [Candidatus Woesearchaeota archaeon]
MARIIQLVMVMLLLVGGALALTIDSPSGEVESPVDVLVTANETQDSIEFSISPGDITLSCDNCSELADSYELDAGNYTLTASSDLGNLTDEATVDFSVMEIEVNDTPDNDTPVNDTPVNDTETESLELSIISPEAGEQGPNVTFSFETNLLADISYSLGNESVDACQNCTLYVEDRTLEEGDYTLTVSAILGNETDEKIVLFNIVIPTNDTPVNDTDDNQTDTNQTDDDTTDDTTDDDGMPRFTLGLNKLPQSVEAGELTDSELAAIIRANNLNPGIINRLVKTGLLGNESIDAIIETQKTPPGIFRKMFGFFGIHIKTPKEKLMTEYDLTLEQEEELLEQDDVQTVAKKKIAKSVENKGGKVPPGLAKKQAVPLEAGDSEPTAKTPPGLAKKQDDSENGSDLPPGLANKNGKVPPGQAKK